MELIDSYRKDGVLDCYTFVFDEKDPRTGFFTMLALSEDGSIFSQWTSGHYEPGGSNEHLGERPRLMSEGLLDHILRRLTEGE